MMSEPDGYNTTVTLDCGCSFRLNIQGMDRPPEPGWYYSCPTGQHSQVREYDSRTGDPIHERDRRVATALVDGLGPGGSMEP